MQDRYAHVKESFQKEFNIDVLNILEYKALRFINRNTWESAKKSKNINPRFVYKPAPETWDLWSNAEIKTRSINSSNFKIQDIQSIHKMALSKNIMSFWAVYLKGASPGKIRSRISQMAPEFFYDCDKNTISKEKVDFYKNYDVLDAEGKSLLLVSFYQCSNSENYKGHVSYLESKKVPNELNRWLNSFNGENLGNLSPIENIADLQRWFVSIHPFGDGNGRTSRFLQDIYLSKWKLPLPLSGDLQNDLETPQMEYRQNMQNSMNATLLLLESCLSEYRTDKESISPTCHTVDEVMK